MSLINESDKYIFSTYKRFPIVLLKGKGTKVWDQDGKEYLDFVTGLAVCSLGHCHPKVVEAIEAQAKILLHVSNLFHIKPQIELARLLVENSFADKVFFCNSGAEANEGAIKLTRKYMRDKKEDRFEILHVVEGSGRLRDPRWEEVPLKKGATVLVPACVAAYEIAPLRRLEIIRAAGFKKIRIKEM